MDGRFVANYFGQDSASNEKIPVCRCWRLKFQLSPSRHGRYRHDTPATFCTARLSVDRRFVAIYNGNGQSGESKELCGCLRLVLTPGSSRHATSATICTARPSWRLVFTPVSSRHATSAIICTARPSGTPAASAHGQAIVKATD